jgi:hypothetical protein
MMGMGPDLGGRLVPGPAFWASLLMLAAIGVPMLLVGRRITRDPTAASWIVGWPLFTLGAILTAISAGMFGLWVFTWLWFVAALLGLLR